VIGATGAPTTGGPFLAGCLKAASINSRRQHVARGFTFPRFLFKLTCDPSEQLELRPVFAVGRRMASLAITIVVTPDAVFLA
jgi:hypothetical protein